MGAAPPRASLPRRLLALVSAGLAWGMGRGECECPAGHERRAIGEASSACEPCLEPGVRCGLLVDRHVEKNGGTTLRTLFMRNMEEGRCVRFYYYLHELEGTTAGCAKCAADRRTFSRPCMRCRHSLAAAANLSFHLRELALPVRLVEARAYADRTSFFARVRHASH